MSDQQKNFAQNIDHKLVKYILLKAREQSKSGKSIDPWTHGIPYDIQAIKDCCEYLQQQGYLEGTHFGDGYSEPDPAIVKFINVLSDHNVFLGHVTKSGQTLLESLISQESGDLSQNN